MTNTTELGWVDGPDGRGTANIIWTCLSTLILCLWSSWHPDVPDTPKRQGFWRRTLEKIGMIMCLLLLPEAGVATAVHQATVATVCKRTLRRAGYDQWTTQHCLFAEMGGIQLDVGQEDPATQGPRKRYRERLSCLRLMKAVEDGVLPKKPPISKSEIGQLSKADFLTKAIALSQVTWFLVQLIARKAQNLAISQMEVTCAAYVFYAAVVYIAWWQKPLDVTSITRIAIPGIHMPSKDPGLNDSVGTKNMKSLIFGFSQHGLITWQGLLYIVVFAIFGSIHCAAWNATFQSAAERTLWRVSSLVISFAYALLLPITDLENWVSKRRARPKTSMTRRRANIIIRAIEIIGTCLIVSYFLARLYVLVEAVISLRRAPPSLYETVDWTKYLPYIA